MMIMDVACAYDLYIDNAYQEMIRECKVVLGESKKVSAFGGLWKKLHAVDSQN